MKSTPAQFKEIARLNTANQHLRQVVRKATIHSLTKRAEVVAEIPDWESVRTRGHDIRKHAIEHLDKYLEQFEEQCRSRNIEVLWSRDAAEACEHVERIVRQTGGQGIVKSKSMVTEEIRLNAFLQRKGFDCVETDLGEYIVQLAGESPSHITAPALHKSKEDIARLFEDKLGVPYTSDPSQLTRYARANLRQKFLEADVGISGANFLVADSGTIVIVENEGNACITTSLPKTHIVITGIEKVVPSIEGATVLLNLLPKSATGQKITTYVNFITSPRQQDELDGPERLVVILLDNGRSDILRDTVMRESLFCIRCGACMNVCPVFQTVGGHAYGSTYPGPIGAVVTPLLTSLSSSKDLPFASSLCGACSEICPVKIDIHHLLLWLRAKAVREHLNSIGERVIISLWRFGMKHPSFYMLGSRLLRTLFKMPPAIPVWSNDRSSPSLAPKTFHELWKNGEVR